MPLSLRVHMCAPQRSREEAGKKSATDAETTALALSFACLPRVCHVLCWKSVDVLEESSHHHYSLIHGRRANTAQKQQSTRSRVKLDRTLEARLCLSWSPLWNEAAFRYRRGECGKQGVKRIEKQKASTQIISTMSSRLHAREPHTRHQPTRTSHTCCAHLTAVARVPSRL